MDIFGSKISSSCEVPLKLDLKCRYRWRLRGGPPGVCGMPVPGAAWSGAVRCHDVVSACSRKSPGRGRGRDSERRLPGGKAVIR